MITSFDEALVVASPTPISIEVGRFTIPNPGDTLGEFYDGDCTDHRDVHARSQVESRPISGRPDFANLHDGPADPVIPAELASGSPGSPFRPPSQYSYRPASQYAGCRSGCRPESQCSHHASSEHSYCPSPSLNGAESAARGYFHEHPNLSPSPPAPSVAGSVASRVYRASRPTARLRKTSPMNNAPLLSLTTESVHRVHDGVGGSLGSSLVSPPPKSQLRPMIGISRYQKHKMVTLENVVKKYVCPPVTTQFMR